MKSTTRVQKNKYAIVIFMLLFLFISIKDRLIDLNPNIVLVITISLVTLVSFLAYLKFREDKKTGKVNYSRIAIAGVFITWTIGYGIYMTI